MLIVHIISTEDTLEFSRIYQGIENDGVNNTILINPSSERLKNAIINEKDKIVFIGHGTDYGLLNQDLDGYILDNRSVELLRGKDVVGIWCYAANFADYNHLSGFFTSMFISNIDEMLNNGFDLFDSFDECEVEISRQNKLFSMRVNELLLNNVPTSEWRDRLIDMLGENEHRFVLYNYEAIYSTKLN